MIELSPSIFSTFTADVRFTFSAFSDGNLFPIPETSRTLRFSVASPVIGASIVSDEYNPEVLGGNITLSFTFSNTVSDLVCKIILYNFN